MEAEAAEGVLQHQVRGLGAVAAPPGVPLADRDVVERRAVVAVELAERARPDEPVRVAHVDRERERVRARDPAAKNRSISSGRMARLVALQAGDLGVGVPALERGAGCGACAAAGRPSAWIAPGSQLGLACRRTYTIAAMRRWSEVAERIAATTRTTEKRASWPPTSEALHPERLAIAAVFFAGRRLPGPTSGPPGSAGRPSRRRDAGGRRHAGARRRLRPTRPTWGCRRRRPRRARPVATAVSATRARTVRPEPPVPAPRGRRRVRRDRRRGRPARRRGARGSPPALRSARRAVRVRIAVGELRIGLRDGLLEAAIARAFDRPPAAVSRAGMLTGDPAGPRSSRARTALPTRLRRFQPIQLMLASPAEDAAEILARLGPVVWVEDKYDGIRVQLHRRGA